MIFDLDDKKVNVEIPLTAKKLKPEIIDYLYDNYSSDEIYHKLRDYTVICNSLTGYLL